MLAEAALIGLICWAVTRNSFFWADDYLYLEIAELNPMSIQFLRQSNFGHFAPVTRLLYWIFQRFLPLNFFAAHLFTSAVYLGCVACLAVLVRRLAGVRVSGVVAIAWFGLSVFSLRVLDWWGASVHIYVAFLFSLLSLVFFVRWFQEGRASDRWLSVAAFAAALLVQERPLLVPLYLVLLRYAILPTGQISWRSTITSIREEIRIWVPYTVVFVAAIAHLRALYSDNTGVPSFAVVGRFLRLSLSEGFLPGLAGSFYFENLTDARWRPPFALAQVMGLALLVGVVGWSFTRRHAARAWLVAFIVYVVNMVLLTSGRRDVFDPLGRATDLQYYVEVHFFFCLAVALAYRGELRSKRALRPAAIVALALVSVLVAGNTARGARDLITITYHPRVARDYVERISAGFDRLRSSGPVDILPIRVPPSVAFPFIIPYDDHVTFLRLFPDLPTTDVDAERKYVVDFYGAVRPVVPYVHTSEYQQPAFEISGSVRDQPVDADGQRCFVPDASTINVTLPSPVTSTALFVALDYRSDRAQTVRLAQDVGGGEIKYRSWAQTIPSGRHVAYLRLEAGTAERIYVLDLAAGSRFCMRGIDVVSLLFADAVGLDGRCPEVGPFGEPLSALPCHGKFRTLARSSP